MRKFTALIILTIIFSCIAMLFWHNEWVYSLPTPVPANYHQVNTGHQIELNTKLPTAKNKPVLLHFFNPECPCSRFNLPHFKSLVSQYGDKVECAIVVMSKKNYTAEEVQDKFDLSIPVLFDKSLADSCGVYSTPQAVILDAQHKLYYRGNYNKTRYCTDKKSNYAQMALDFLLNNNTKPIFTHEALNAYGCKLPDNCKK